ncbi:MAG TPA: hydantoinase/oxoprolinase family protein [Dehalococcoidia bacterium]|nr:hydantoinase/oxoprolinase family protein [Dehalococcoidia bacterium]
MSVAEGPSILGVDIGGTFTDFLLVEEGRLTVYKRPSTPDDPARGVLEGLAEMRSAPGEVVHGSTVATNAIIERKGARTALITTRGFRDVLVIGRQTRPGLYDLSPQRPPPLVPDDLRLEANERLDHQGHVLQPLDPAEVELLLDDVAALGVESLAVCFLFSFINPDHERLIAKRARRRGLLVSVSHEVLPEHREYERTSTTVANAYVAPVMARYLSGLEQGLRRRGVRRLRVMASNGGSISPAAAGRLAVRTVLSGPAGGVAGAFAIARTAGFDRIITLDMGGTSTDVSLCPGRLLERDEARVGDLPIRGPALDVLSMGAGGGSLARLDEGGALRVGPESAGADPGPACYGKGDLPTVTDAHVVLGRIAPEQFLGGRMPLRPQRSLDALHSLAAPFRGDLARAADAVLRVANAGMERALRVVSVERGFDPRQFTLVAFGGAGPLHACELAAALRLPRVLVPPYPGVLSALGMATAPVVKDLSAAAMLTLAGQSDVGATFRPALSGAEGSPATSDSRASTPEDATATLRSLFRDLRRRGVAELRDEGFLLPSSSFPDAAEAKEERSLEMRYLGQSYELSVPVDALSPSRFLPRFHALHHERYGHSDPSRPVEIVTARLKLVLPPSVGAPLAAPPAPETLSPNRAPSAAGALIARRPVWFAQTGARPGDGRPHDTPIYDRSRLAPGHAFRGPAIVVQMDATTAVPPGWHATVDPFANLILERRNV